MSFFGFRRDNLEDQIARDMSRTYPGEEVVIVEETVIIEDGYNESVVVIEEEYFEDSWEYSED